MGLVPNIVLLASGVIILIWIYRDESRGSETGWNSPYLGVRSPSCSSDAFRAKIRLSILKSLLWRAAIIATLALAVCVWCVYTRPDDLDALGDVARLSLVEYFSLWMSTSMIAMVDRAHVAMSGRF